MVNLKVPPEEAIFRLQEKVNEMVRMRAKQQAL